MRKRVGPPLLAVALVLLVLAPVWRQAKLEPLGSYDQGFYLGIAYDLVHSGRFTDGFAYGVALPSGERPSGMRFVPLYPALVAAAYWLEPGFAAAGACVVRTYPDYQACSDEAGLVRAMQFGMLAAVYVMVWWLAAALTGSARGGWIGLAVALVTAPYLVRSVDYVMTEITTLLLSTASTCAAVAAVRARGAVPRLRRVAATGVLLGLSALTRPAFLYLFYAVAAGMAMAAVVALVRRRGWSAGLLLGVFVAGFAVPVGPWVVRNAVVLGRAELSFGYASHTLVQRISFDAMTPREYALSYVCGLPDGSGLGRVLAGAGACDRFALDDRPGTFYQIGTGPLLTQTLAASGGYENHLSYLLHHYIYQEPLKHALVTIPMALRGAWVDHYWGLVLGLLCLWMTGMAVRRRDAGFLALALPAWFMLLFNAAVAVNQVRYNLMLVPPYAVAAAMAGEGVLRRSRLKVPPQKAGG